MESMKLNFVRDGVVKLPPGFQFEPTDEEIVFQYLKCKVFGLPLPATVIPEINVCDLDPSEFPGESNHHKYYFCNQKVTLCGTSYRAAGHIYWKPTKECKLILSSKLADGQIMGLRKTLVFQEGPSSDRSAPSDWIMHKYNILFTSSSAHCNSQSSKSSLPQHRNSLMMRGGWTLCHIFRKNKDSTRSEHPTDKKRARNTDSTSVSKFLKLNTGGKPTLSFSSPSSSSDITEISSTESDTDESSC